MAVLPSRNPIPGSATGMVGQTIPGGGGVTTQANVPLSPTGYYFDRPAAQGGKSRQSSAKFGVIGKGPDQQTSTPTADMSLPDYSYGDQTFSSTIASPSDPTYSSPSRSSGSSGSSGMGSGGSGSLSAMRSLAGMGSGGGGMAVGGLSAGGAALPGGIGAPDAGLTAVPSEAPQAPGSPSSLPGDLGGHQMLSGPMMGRQGLGQRVPPSLAAMLKPKVY